MSRENPIRKTTGKGGNYRPTKSGEIGRAHV